MLSGRVSHFSTVVSHMVPPEMSPLMSGEPTVKEKLMIDACFIHVCRYCDDSRAFNWDSTPNSLAWMSNVKYHVRELGHRRRRGCARSGAFSAASWLADMTQRIIVGNKLSLGANSMRKDLCWVLTPEEAQFGNFGPKAGNWRFEVQPAPCPFPR